MCADEENVPVVEYNGVLHCIECAYFTEDLLHRLHQPAS